MNRFEFYDRLKDYNALQHANKYGPASGTNKYYAKLDDFYGKGKPRYFYSKEEWDAYQKAKAQSEGAKKDEQNRAYKNTQSNNSVYQDNYKKNEEAAKAGNGEKDRYNKQEWNEASKKTGLSYKKGTNKAWDNQYKKDKKALDEAFWQGKGDLKKAQENMHKYDFNMESGHGFDDPQEWPDEYKDINNGKPYINDFNFAFSYPEGDITSDNKAKAKFIKENQPVVDHCVEFYELYCLKNDRLTEQEVRDEIKRYLSDHKTGYKGEVLKLKDIPGVVDALYNNINDRLKSEKKAWDRTHKEEIAEKEKQQEEEKKIKEAESKGKKALLNATFDKANEVYDNLDMSKYYEEGDDAQTVINKMKKDGLLDEIKKNMKILYDQGYVSYSHTPNETPESWLLGMEDYDRKGPHTTGLDIYDKIKDSLYDIQDLSGTDYKKILNEIHKYLLPPNYDPEKVYIDGAAAFPDKVEKYAKNKLGIDLSKREQKILTQEEWDKLQDYWDTLKNK